MLRSIDMGAMEIIRNYEELQDYKKVGSPFSIPKAALSLAGFGPSFSAESYASLEEHLKAFGLEVSTAASVLACGSNAVILKHPTSVATISKLIKEMM